MLTTWLPPQWRLWHILTPFKAFRFHPAICSWKLLKMSFVLSFIGLSAKPVYRRKQFLKPQGCWISSRCCLHMWLVCSSDMATNTTTGPHYVGLQSVIWPEHMQAGGSHNRTIHHKKKDVKMFKCCGSFLLFLKKSPVKATADEHFWEKCKNVDAKQPANLFTSVFHHRPSCQHNQPLTPRWQRRAPKICLSTLLEIVDVFRTKGGKNAVDNVSNLTYWASFYQSHKSLKGGLQGFDHAFNWSVHKVRLS